MVFKRLNIHPNQNFGATKSTFEKARSLRKDMTNSEQILWQRLRKKQLNGLHFRRQHAIDCFIVDFYCHEKKLVIELDGTIHDYQNQYDMNRQSCLEELGLKVLRFKNEEVENNIDIVLKDVFELVSLIS